MNGPSHRTATALSLAAGGFASGRTTEERQAGALLGGTGGYIFACLPDWIEPATNPNHRQFFHSVAFGVVLGIGLYKLYKWEPETAIEEVVRVTALVAGAAYFVHLFLDSTTPRSLPLVGRIY
jgi:inner membrane protein